MINIIFICVLGSTTKQIKSGIIDTRIGKECRVMIDDKKVGSAQHNLGFCDGLATKVKLDMERKGFKCAQQNIK